MSVDLGNIKGLYLSATLQTGGNRFLTSNFTEALLLQNVTLTIGRDVIDASTFDDLMNRAFKAGRKTVTLSFSGLWDHDGDTGQVIARTAALADTQATALIAGLVTSDVSGDDEYYFEGIPNSFVITDPDNAVSTVSGNITINTASLAFQAVT